MFDYFMFDIIEMFDDIQVFVKQEGLKDFGLLNKVIEVFKYIVMDMEQCVICVMDVNNCEQFCVLLYGFFSVV